MATDFYKSGSSYYTSTGTKIKDPNELQTLAKAGGKEIKAPVVPTGSVAIPNPTAIKDYNVTANIGGTLYGNLKTPTVAPVAPTVPDNIKASDVKQDNFKTTTTPTETTDAFVSGLGIQNKTINDFITESRAKNQEEITAQQNLINQYGDIGAKLSTEGTRLTEERAKLGIPTMTTQLADLNTRMATIGAEYDKLISKTEALPFSVTGVSGEVGRATKAKAVELGGLSSIAQAIQGNITTATETAKATIDAEFSPLKNQITTLQNQITANYSLMSAAQKTRADELNAVLEKNKADIEKQEAEKTQVYNTMITAAQNGADNATLNNIRNAKTQEDAVLMATGATPINTPAELKGLTENDIIRVGNKIYKKGTKNYLKAQDTGKYSVTKIGTDTDGNEIYGSFDQTTGKINPIDTGINNISSGIINGYNISSYATDPNHEKAIADILSRIGKFETVSDIDNYIKSKYPNSPITGQMIANASQKYGVSWEMLVAMMEQDSSLGTAGKGARTYNPGNVGNTDSGATRNYGNWQAGVDAVGNWLNNHKVTGTNQIDEVSNLTKLVESGQLTTEKALSQVSKGNNQSLQNALANVDSKTSQNAIQTKTMALDLIKDLKQNASSTWAVGWSSPLANIKGTKMYDYKTKYDSLRDLLALGNIDKLKGAMSDKDIEFLRNSASSLQLGTTRNEFIKQLDQLEFRLNNPTSSVSEMTKTNTNPLGINIVTDNPLGLSL